MSLKQTILAIAVGSALVLLGAPAFSQTVQGGTVVVTTTTTTTNTSTTKLATTYSTFAGSPSNAETLIVGLRDDTSITLVASPDGLNPTAPPATFTPATGKLGYGNINIALSLAKADLAKQGISNPTPAQLAAALNGGTITTTTGPVTMAGVLAQRQAGLGWGQIAKTMGVKLGSIVSASKTAKAGAKAGKSSNLDKSQAKAGKSAALDKSQAKDGKDGKGESGGKGGGGNSGGNGGGNGGGDGGGKK